MELLLPGSPLATVPQNRNNIFIHVESLIAAVVTQAIVIFKRAKNFAETRQDDSLAPKNPGEMNKGLKEQCGKMNRQF